MLFDSLYFLFVFLPLVWVVFQALCWTRSPNWLVISWLIGASLYFYGSIHGKAILLFLILAGFNFILGRILRSLADRPEPPAKLLWMGILINAGCLLGLKYLPAATVFSAIVLPVGFSFFIFAQIGYLVDASQGNTPIVSPLRYLLFSVWFPYILSGPIVKVEEVNDQFQFNRTTGNDLSLGLSYIAMGLFKKCCLASAAAAVAVPFFVNGSVWLHTGALPAWIGAFAFTLQIYFDFSGYSDMAIGIARLFGIKLPINFNSPLKALNTSEFWNRSHMTLTRFLMYYIYNPLALAMTRAKAARQPVKGPRKPMSATDFLGVVAFPLMITMLIAGAWHGASWTFVAFGLLHGIFLTTVHGWHLIKSRTKLPALPAPLANCIAHLLMLTSLAVSLVFFGSPTCTAARSMLASMVGRHGWLITNTPLPTPLTQSLSTLTILFLIVFLLPNSQEWLGRDETPIIPLPRVGLSEPGKLQRWFWEPWPRYTLLWGSLILPALVAILSSPSASGFIYFKF